MSRLKATPAEIEKHLALLAETPQRLATAVAGLDDAHLSRRPAERTWSAVEVLAHLRACDEVWSFSIYAMLAQDAPVLPLLDERRWAKTLRYADLGFVRSLQAFGLRRGELLHVLRQLPAESWQRSGVIEGRTHTVFSQVRRMALHEAEHCEQIETLLAESKQE